MIYYNNFLKIPNTKYDRYLFSDIFITNSNSIGLISIIYPDIDIKFDQIECYISLLNKSFYFNKKIMREKYESNVFAYIEDNELQTYICKKDIIKITIKYKDISRDFNLNKLKNIKYNLAFATLFKDDYYLLLSWIEYYLKIGVEHFFLYYNNKIDVKITNLINKYIENNIVTLIEWNFVHKLPEIQKLDPKIKLVKKSYKVNYHHSQPMSMAHCLNYYGPMCKWLGYFDLDEYLVLNKHLHLNNLLKEYNLNKTASVKFYCMWADLLDCDFKNESVKFGHQIFLKYNSIRKKESEGTFYRTKCIVRPENIKICGVHRVKEYDKYSFTEYLIDEKIGYHLHYFRLSGGWGGRDKRNPLKNQDKILDNQIVKMIKFNS